jgi:predicted esterase YcpF (UPF0227 family)
MSLGETASSEAKRRALISRLQEAETSLRSALHMHGFGTTPRAHMERALSHVHEAYIAINENKPVRSVHQLADDLTRIEKVVDDATRKHSQRI